jgi:hypothetical protein
LILTGSGLPEDNSHTSCVLVLLRSIDVAVLLLGVSISSFISRGEVIRKLTKSVTT